MLIEDDCEWSDLAAIVRGGSVGVRKKHTLILRERGYRYGRYRSPFCRDNDAAVYRA